MEETGNFFLGDVDSIFNLNEELPDEDLSTIDLNDLFENDFELFEATSSTIMSVSETSDMKRAMEMKPSVPVLSPDPSMSTGPGPERFKKLTEEDLQNIDSYRQSKSTKKNTHWGVNVFQAWSMESEGNAVNFQTILPEELCVKLRKFYAEAQPQNVKLREKCMPKEQAKEYHKNTMKSIRSAINRHIQNIGRNFDIVRDTLFKSANNILDAKLKYNLNQGVSRPTQHKEIISVSDLDKIKSYLFSETSPIILRFRVRYLLAIHFVSRGIEFHQQLNLQSFQFKRDENNVEYAAITHETKQKNRQGGINMLSNELETDKRMYATNDEFCPVASLKLFIHKTDPTSDALFNHCISMSQFEKSDQYWYSSKPVKQNQFSRFMTDISKHAKCNKYYTAHCLRATSIQTMNDAGYQLRHIMFMSGHKNESSVRSYNRYCSSEQKRRISETLSSMSTTRENVAAGDLVPTVPRGEHSGATSTVFSSTNAAFNVPISLNSSSIMSSGFISNSSFNNCVFQFSNGHNQH